MIPTYPYSLPSYSTNFDPNQQQACLIARPISPLMIASYSLLSPAAALHPGPPDSPDHQDLAVREEGGRHVFPHDLLLPDVLDALRRRVHVGGLREAEHGLSHSGHHPLVLCQVQHGLQPPHLRVHEQKGWLS